MGRGFCTAKGLHGRGFAWFSCGKPLLMALQDKAKQKRKLVGEHTQRVQATLQCCGLAGATSAPGGAGLCDFHPQGMYFAHQDNTGVCVYLQRAKFDPGWP